MALRATITLALTALLEGLADLSNNASSTYFSPSTQLTNGTLADQANEMFSDQRTLAASATENLDLSGSLVDAFGVVLVFTKIKAIIVRAAAANVNDVVIGGVGANGWLGCFGATTDTLKIKPGGFLCVTAPNLAGMPVTAGTGDLLKVANGGAGTGVTYDIIIIGVV